MSTADATLVLGLSLMAAWLVAVVALRRRVPPGVLAGLGVAAVCFALYAGVVDAVADPAPLAGADAPVLAWLVAHRTPGLDTLLRAVSTVGGTLGMTVLAAAGALVLLVRQRMRHALLVVVAAAGAGLLVTLTKNLYQRERPPLGVRLTVETTYSLPSGHALGSAVVLGVLAVVAILGLRSATARALVAACAVLGTLIIGFSRLYLGAHWLTDVLAGWLLGAAWLALCVTLVRPRTTRASDLEEQAVAR